MPAACKYNWSDAEHTFINAPDWETMTLKVISDQYNIPYQTVRRYAAQHKWISQRDALVYQSRKLTHPARTHVFSYSPRGLPKSIAALLHSKVQR
ncbi:hypothetical protein AB4Z22_00115 [Paenibacillus sp. TAF58]